MNQTHLREWLEGRRGGLFLQLLRRLLVPFALVWGCILKIRTWGYRTGIFHSAKAPVPVISVGNLTAGGTGKTPMCITLVELSRQLGFKHPAILMRGYNPGHAKESDEARLYRMRLDNVPVYVGSNRVQSMKKATADGADLLILDDGFQHLKLKRDADIVLLDATCPFGGGWPIPAGILREFPSALGRADLVVLSRCAQARAEQIRILLEQLEKRYPKLPVIQSDHSPDRLVLPDGNAATVSDLSGKRVFAISGIGRPDAFLATLRSLGAEITGSVSYADHHAYTEDDLRQVLVQAQETEAIPITTEKDAVKFSDASATLCHHFAVLGIGLQLSDDLPLRKLLRSTGFCSTIPMD